jgi:hypothetical protein
MAQPLLLSILPTVLRGFLVFTINRDRLPITMTLLLAPAVEIFAIRLLIVAWFSSAIGWSIALIVRLCALVLRLRALVS